MIKTGQVVEKQQGGVKVCFHRPEMCEKCGACVGKSHKEVVFIKGDAAVGDMVDVEMPDAKVLKASALAYLVPLMGFMVGLVLGQVLFHTDLAAALGGAVGLIAVLLCLHLMDKKISLKNNWQPKIISVRKKELQNE